MPDLPFSRDEYDSRLTKTRASMTKAGLDAIFVTDPSNMAWLTGYDGWSFYVHQGVLLTHEGEPVWWGRGMDAVGAERTTYLLQGNIIGYDDTYVQNPAKHPMETLAALMRDRGLEKARIGCEFDNYYFTASALISLQKGLPQAQIDDATGLVNWQRAVKSDTEIEYMRRAARIVEKMHAVIRDKAEPGLPLQQGFDYFFGYLCQRHAHNYYLNIAAETGLTFVHPFDDPRVIAGQGTAALELIEEAGDLDATFKKLRGLVPLSDEQVERAMREIERRSSGGNGAAIEREAVLASAPVPVSVNMTKVFW